MIRTGAGGVVSTVLSRWGLVAQFSAPRTALIPPEFPQKPLTLSVTFRRPRNPNSVGAVPS